MTVSNITEMAENMNTNTVQVSTASEKYAFFGNGTFNPSVTGNECIGIMVSASGVPQTAANTFTYMVINDTTTLMASA